MKAISINDKSVKTSVCKCNLEGTIWKGNNGVHNLLVPLHCINKIPYHQSPFFSVSDSATFLACTPGGA